MKQKIILFPLLLLIAGSLFAMNEYIDKGTDEGRYENVEEANSKIAYEFELGTIWAYDFETEHSGFRSIIDLDFKYVFNPFSVYKSETSGIDYDKPYGVLEVAGMSSEFVINNEDGDKSEGIIPAVDMNYELIYGTIVFDPFYLLIASSEQGNRYDRNHGYTFSRGRSSIRANIAHVGYNIPWTGMIMSTIYGDSGDWNSVSETKPGASMGLGYIIDTTEILLQIGSPADWENNLNDEYDLGFQLESNPVGNLTVKAHAFTGINYDIMPLGFALGAGYRQELTDSISLVPFVGYDHIFVGTDDSMTDSFNSEIAVGVSLVWPGGQGWGYEPLNDKDLNRYSGLTLGVDIATYGDADESISLMLTSYEETSGGIIPNLGASVILEWQDVTNNMDKDYKRIAFGLYLDYNVMDMLKPFIRTHKTSGVEDSAISFESGIEYTAIPNTIITVGYDTANIDDLDNNKGLFYTEFKVIL